MNPLDLFDPRDPYAALGYTDEELLTVRQTVPAGYVYALRVLPDGPIKIGYSGNPRERVAYAQTDCPYELGLMGCIPGTHDIERGIHALLADHRMRGEWFHPTLAVERWCAENLRTKRHWDAEWKRLILKLRAKRRQRRAA